jgi:hypothetical protein
MKKNKDLQNICSGLKKAKNHLEEAKKCSCCNLIHFQTDMANLIIKDIIEFLEEKMIK